MTMTIRVVTTCTKQGFEDYGFRWLEGRANWPKGTDFRFYTEGFNVDCPGKDFRDLPDFSAWKLRHARYQPPNWRWGVVGFAHKVFAACDALFDHDGIGIWLDADCVTHRKVPKKLIESSLGDAYMARFERPGLYTETGMWMVDCRHPQHRDFLGAWRNLYLSDGFKKLPAWTDCHTLDYTLRQFRFKLANLSGEHGKTMHPMALSEWGKYVDHLKGPRKALGYSPENKHRKAA